MSKGSDMYEFLNVLRRFRAEGRRDFRCGRISLGPAAELIYEYVSAKGGVQFL